MARQRKPRRGDRVLIERDEERWPAKGTWKNYRGREATVLTVNRTDKEYGVTFGAVRERPDGSLAGADTLTWFLAHELTVLDSTYDGGSSPVVKRGSSRTVQVRDYPPRST